MNVLIVGASTKESIGYAIGLHLKKQEHAVTCASSSGRQIEPLWQSGIACQLLRIEVPRDVRDVFCRLKPDLVVHAAGLYMPACPLGSSSPSVRFSTWMHLEAKCYGAYLLFDAAAKYGATYVVALGGREISSNPGYAHYTIGNGALWAAVRFAHAHTTLRSYYIDLPLVDGSAMAQEYLKDPSVEPPLPGTTVAMAGVVRVIEEILAHKHEPGSRIVLGEQWSV